jgi:hypothetical protein
MKIRTVKHRGLKRLIEDNDPREVRGDLVKRIGNILAFLVASSGMDTMRSRQAGVSISSSGTAQKPGASRSLAIGALLS